MHRAFDLDAPETVTPVAGETSAEEREHWRSWVADLGLLVLFLVVDWPLLRYYIAVPDAFGGDAAVYRIAALAWIQGGNPWTVNWHGILFAGPPPTLLTALPFVGINELVARAAWIGIGVGASVFAVRRLRLPLWWVLFPPLFGGFISGNPNPLVLALLLTPVAPLAVVAKIYALIPLLLLRRWRAATASCVVLLATVPFLPWAQFIASSGRIATTFAEQAPGFSAWGTLLAIPTAIAIVALGRRGAWLAVPALWPATQIHYNALGLPASSRLVAALLSLQVPLAPTAAVAAAVVEQLRLRDAGVGVPVVAAAAGTGADYERGARIDHALDRQDVSSN